MKNIYKTIFLCLLTSVLCPPISFSQTAPGIEWAKCFGGTSVEQAFSIQETVDGGYVTAGFTASNNGDVSGNHGDWDFWVVKTDSAGNLQWQKCLGGTDWDQASCIKQTADSGYIVVGLVHSNDGDVSGNHSTNGSTSDCWIAKLDIAGTLQWQKCFGGSGDESANAVIQAADGGYTVLCTTLSNDGDVTGNHGQQDFWIIKTDNAGNLQWQKCFGGTDREYATDIKTTADGGYIATGYTESNDGDVSGNHTTTGTRFDYWVLKIDSAGNLQWQKCLGGTESDFGWSIVTDTDGGYTVSGNTFSIDGDVTNNNDTIPPIGEDYWVVKLDSSANIQWEKCYGGYGGEDSYDISGANDGGYIIAGTAVVNDGDVTGHHGTTSSDYWIVKTDSTGTLQWENCFGGSGGETPFDIIQADDGGYVVTGFTSSNNFDVSGNHGNSDFWIIKLAPDTITSITQLPQLPNYPITISPNPLTTQSKLTFKNPNKEKFLFTLYDITGRVTESVSTTYNEIILTKGSKLAGVYLFNLVNEKTGERMEWKNCNC